jgi:hypothetical protein
MALPNHLIAEAIDTAPLNRGLKGADWLARPGNVPVTFDNGDIALFDYEGDGVYQVHFLFQSRGGRPSSTPGNHSRSCSRSTAPS